MAFAYIVFWAIQLKVNIPLMIAVCDVESNLSHTINENDGGSPSYGACQVKEIAARDVGFVGLRDELTDPEHAVFWAVKYFKKQLKRYKGDKWKAVAAYNAGSVKYVGNKFVNQNYVDKVKKRYRYWKHTLRRLIK